MWFASLVTHMNHPKPGQGFIHTFSNSNTNSRTIFSQDQVPTPFHDIQGPSPSGPHLPFPSPFHPHLPTLYSHSSKLSMHLLQRITANTYGELTLCEVLQTPPHSIPITLTSISTLDY